MKPTTKIKQARLITFTKSGDPGIRIDFPYSQRLVEIMRSLSGKFWHQDKKCWTAHLTMENLDALIRADFLLDSGLTKYREKHNSKQSDHADDMSVPMKIKGLGGTLYPYQEEGVAFIERKNGRALIADEMGTGKTIETLAWLQMHPEKRPVIIVTPASVKLNWRKEARIWMENPKIAILSGRNGKPLPEAEIYIINYDILYKWIHTLKEIEPQVLITDESSFYKNNKAKRTKAVKWLAKGIPYFIALSGTPIVNRPAEIHNAIYTIDPMTIPPFWEFARRYCLPGNAPILMEDLSTKNIKDIAIGDKVVGWTSPTEKGKQRRLTLTTVKNVLIRKAPLQKVILTNGDEVICTPDHRWLTGPKKNSNEYSIAKTGKLGGRGRNCASKTAKIFSGITKPVYVKSKMYKKGYLIGLFRGDGYCTKITKTRFDGFKYVRKPTTYNYKVSAAMIDTEPIDRAEKYLQFLNIHYIRGIQKSKKHYSDLHILHCDNQKAYDFFTRNPFGYKGKAWYAGFLAGMYDAEGSYQYIHQSEKLNSINCDLIEDALKVLNIPYIKRRQAHKVIRFMLIGGRSGLLTLWSACYPSLTRKLQAMLFNAGGRFISGNLSTGENIPFVKEIIPLDGMHTVYTLTTETGNYVAYGYGSKNCNLRNDGFGWKYDGATNTKELHELLKSVMIRRLKKDVLKDLPPKTRAFVPMELENRSEYVTAEQNFIEFIREEKGRAAAEKASHAEYLVKISTMKQLAAHGKLNNVISWIRDFLEVEDKLVVFAHHKAVITRLMEEFGDIAVKIDGSVTGEHRQTAVDRFQEDPEIKLFIGNLKAAGVGITLTAANNAAIIELPWSPGDLVQVEDRLHRIGQEENVTIHYLLAEDTVDEHIASILDKKAEVLKAVLDGKAVDEENLLTELINIYEPEN